jgi:radical SAM protein with 4Fe4S-binding SPASM domain
MDCHPPMSRAFLHAYENFIPLTVTLEITLGCNLRCVHCYNFDRSGPAPAERKEGVLAPAEVLRIIDEVATEGALFLSFTGGEALLHPHLLEFVARARANRLYVRLKSNGMLLTPERARALADAGVADVEISVYGARPETHDAFTTVPGSFDKTIRGIASARDAGLRPIIAFILHRRNCEELDAMFELARELGVSFNLGNEITARYDGSSGQAEHQMTPEQFRALLNGPHGERFDVENTSGGVQCPCARNVCGISSTGDVYPCIGAPIASGNLREKSFREIWRESPQLNRIRGLKIEDFHACEPCAYRGRCARSSGSAYANTGGYTGPDPFACAQAEIRSSR